MINYALENGPKGKAIVATEGCRESNDRNDVRQLRSYNIRIWVPYVRVKM